MPWAVWRAGHRRRPETRPDTDGATGRCRRASSRSGGPAIAHRRNSGRSRRRLIIDSARGHAFAGMQDHADCLGVPSARAVAQEKERLAGAGELGRGAEAAERRVILALEQLAAALSRHGARERQSAGRAAGVIDQLFDGNPPPCRAPGPGASPRAGRFAAKPG